MKKKIDNVLRLFWLLVFPLLMCLWLLMLFLYEIDILELRWVTDELYLFFLSFIPIVWLLGFVINVAFCFYKDLKRRKNND